MAGTRAVIAAAAVLLAGPTLAGCSGGDPVPKVEPSSSGSSPAASSGSPSPSQVALSPEDTVRAWVAARNSALQNGHLLSVRKLTAASCTSCDGILDPIRTVYRHGGRFETKGWRVVAIKTVRRTESAAVVSAGLVFHGGRTFQSRGAQPTVYPTTRHILRFRLAAHDGRWLLKFVGFLS